MAEPLPCIVPHFADQLGILKQLLITIVLPPIGILLPSILIHAVGVSTGVMNRTLGLVVALGYAASISKLLYLYNAVDYRDEDIRSPILDSLSLVLTMIGLGIENIYIYIRCKCLIPNRLQWIRWILFSLIPIMCILFGLRSWLGYSYHYFDYPTLLNGTVFDSDLTEEDYQMMKSQLVFASTSPTWFETTKWINLATLALAIGYNMVCSAFIVTAIRRVLNSSGELNRRVLYVLRSSECRMMVAVCLGSIELTMSTMALRSFAPVMTINSIATLKLVLYMTDSLASLLTLNDNTSKAVIQPFPRRNSFELRSPISSNNSVPRTVPKTPVSPKTKDSFVNDDFNSSWGALNETTSSESRYGHEITSSDVRQ